jgi:hypothetical protein
MGFFKNLSTKIENWLMKEEIEAIRKKDQEAEEIIKNLSPDELRKIEEIKTKIEEQTKYVNEQLELIMNEDLSTSPTQCDIDRYFDYHIQYIDFINSHKENGNMWTVKQHQKYEKSTFDTNGRINGWDFLRESCGLPKGDIKNKMTNEENNGWMS